MKNKVAFFDIDGTIYRDGLITELFKKLISHELVDPSKWYNDVKPLYERWTFRQGEYDDYLERMVEIFTNSIIGLNTEHIIHIAKKVIEQNGDRVYTYTRDAIKKHQLNGTKIIAISGSPLELVAEMAKKYNLDDFSGTIYKKDANNRYTGDVIPMWDSPSKKREILNYVEKYDLNLDECYAYGDTTGDFTMFKLVGHPIAINPTKALITQILNDKIVKEKITIIVERKDMIYNIPVNSLY